jgi:ribonuclease BN (tRNA processing enzyme)
LTGCVRIGASARRFSADPPPPRPHAVTFADRAEVEKLILFHHDPTHDDKMLDRLGEHARRVWEGMGHDPATVSLAGEGESITI